MSPPNILKICANQTKKHFILTYSKVNKYPLRFFNDKLLHYKGQKTNYNNVN
jgi:hypothetical protein